MSAQSTDRKIFFSLLKVMFKGEEKAVQTGMPSLTGEGKKKRGRLLGNLSTGGRFIALLTPFLFLMGVFGYMGYIASQLPVLTIDMLLSSLIFALFMLGITFGFLSAVSYLYYVKDIPFYLSLPLKPEQILKAKFLQYLIYSSLGSLIFIPSLLSFMYFRSFPVHDFISWTLVYMAATLCIDLVVSAIIVLLLRFSKFGHNQERFMMIMSIMGIAFGLGIAILGQFARNIDVAATAMKIQALSSNLFVGLILGLFAPQLFLFKWLASPILWQQLLALGASLLLLALYYWIFLQLGQRYYFDGVLAVQNQSSGRAKKLSARELRRELKGRTPRRALAAVDYLKYRRTPTFFTQVILSPAIMPLFFFVVMGASLYATAQREDGFDIAQIGEILQKVRTTVSELSLREVFVETPIGFIALLVILGMTVFMNLGSTLISRLAVSSDGEDYGFYRSLPITAKNYFMAKAKLPLIMALLPMTFMVLLAAIVVKLPILLSLFLLLMILLVVSIFFNIGMGLGNLQPNFSWDNEMKLFKGGKNVLFIYLQLILNALVLAPIFLLAYFGLKDNSPLGVSFLSLSLIAMGYLLLLFALSLLFLAKTARRLWGKDVP